jgi:hypothetical protein
MVPNMRAFGVKILNKGMHFFSMNKGKSKDVDMSMIN